MGSSSHGGERKGQLGPGVTVPMSGLPPEGYPEGSQRVWTPQEQIRIKLHLHHQSKVNKLVAKGRKYNSYIIIKNSKPNPPIPIFNQRSSKNQSPNILYSASLDLANNTLFTSQVFLQKMYQKSVSFKGPQRVSYKMSFLLLQLYFFSNKNLLLHEI